MDGKAELSPSQKASYLGRGDYITAHVEIDENDATQYRSVDSRTGPSHIIETRIRRNLSTLELPRGTLRQSLLRNFLSSCRPWMPLVDEADLEAFDAKNKDTLLVTSMLVAGSIVSSTPQAAEQGQRCYQCAKILFYTNDEHNHLHTIMATIFMQWLNPSGPEHVSIDNSSFWLRISVALAHQIGLHREPDSRTPEAKLRRRIWWALISRDNQIATSHGRPRAISTEDSNVRPLRIDDFEGGDADGLLFMQYVCITNILGDMTEYYRRGTLTDRRKIDFEDMLRSWLKAVPLSLRLYHPETRKLNDYNFKIRQLHTLYFTALIILFRHEKHNQPPSPVSLLAASFISGIFEEYLTFEDISHLSVTHIFYLMVAALLQVSYQRFPWLATHRRQELEIIKLSLDGLKKRFPSAIGAERVVNQMLKHSTSLPDTAQSTRMVLAAEQIEFFAPFGPELCRKWSLVVDRQPGFLPGINACAGIGHTNNASGTVALINHEVYIGDNGNTLSRQPPISADPNLILDHEGALLFNQDDQSLFPDSMNLDSVGRWWWEDWIGEADMDFLSKSL